MLFLAALACGGGSASALAAPPVAQAPQSAPYLRPLPSAEPVAGGYGVAARGQGNYTTYCAPCHGPCGGGDGPLARMLVPRPARHSDAAFMNALSDEYLFRLLKEGGPALGKSPLMGAWGKTISEQQIRDLVAFLRTLAEPGDRKESAGKQGACQEKS
jgi:mono/diheme cytochrome c family protein